MKAEVGVTDPGEGRFWPSPPGRTPTTLDGGTVGRTRLDRGRRDGLSTPGWAEAGSSRPGRTEPLPVEGSRPEASSCGPSRREWVSSGLWQANEPSEGGRAEGTTVDGGLAGSSGSARGLLLRTKSERVGVQRAVASKRPSEGGRAEGTGVDGGLAGPSGSAGRLASPMGARRDQGADRARAGGTSPRRKVGAEGDRAGGRAGRREAGAEGLPSGGRQREGGAEGGLGGGGAGRREEASVHKEQREGGAEGGLGGGRPGRREEASVRGEQREGGAEGGRDGGARRKAGPAGPSQADDVAERGPWTRSNRADVGSTGPRGLLLLELQVLCRTRVCRPPSEGGPVNEASTTGRRDQPSGPDA